VEKITKKRRFVLSKIFQKIVTVTK